MKKRFKCSITHSLVNNFDDKNYVKGTLAEVIICSKKGR